MAIPAIAWALAAPAIAKGVSSLGNYFNPVKYKKSGFEKNYISELQRRTREGVLTGGMQREIVSQTSRAASQFADIGRSQVQGTVTNQGLENSAVMTQSTMGIEVARDRRVAEAARKISLKNQMFKVGAQNTLGAYGMAETKRKYGMELTKRAHLTSAINSAGSAVGTIAGAIGSTGKVMKDFMNAEGGFDSAKIMEHLNSLSPSDAALFKEKLMEIDFDEASIIFGLT